jgi:hypothetical protein
MAQRRRWAGTFQAEACDYAWVADTARGWHKKHLAIAGSGPRLEFGPLFDFAYGPADGKNALTARLDEHFKMMMTNDFRERGLPATPFGGAAKKKSCSAEVV